MCDIITDNCALVYCRRFKASVLVHPPTGASTNLQVILVNNTHFAHVPNVQLMYSSDGIVWRRGPKLGVGDDQTSAAFDPFRGVFNMLLKVSCQVFFFFFS